MNDRPWEVTGTSDQDAIRAMFPQDHPYWTQLKPRDPRLPGPSFKDYPPLVQEQGSDILLPAKIRGPIKRAGHNQYCNDDWDMYAGDGPRGMGPNGDGCVCSLAPEGYGESQTHPVADQIIREITIAEARQRHYASGPGRLCVCGEVHDIEGSDGWVPGEPEGPRLWDTPPDTVVHVAGMTMVMFGLFMRQRCEWCGVILIEYDLRRVAVPVGQDPMPSSWPTGQLVRVDGDISAVIEDPEVIDGDVKLPMDACAFDPKTQVK